MKEDDALLRIALRGLAVLVAFGLPALALLACVQRPALVIETSYPVIRGPEAANWMPEWRSCAAATPILRGDLFLDRYRRLIFAAIRHAEPWCSSPEAREVV